MYVCHDCREAILLSLLARTFTSKSIVFFDTKQAAHRCLLVLGLAGIRCAELHGNLTMTQVSEHFWIILKPLPTMLLLLVIERLKWRLHAIIVTVFAVVMG